MPQHFASNSSNLILSAGRVDLWLLFVAAVPDEAHPGYRDLLTAEERRKEQRFYFERDRTNYLLTRALVRTTLSRYIPIAPQDWRFEADPYGRPRVVNSHDLIPQLSFNISHTDGLIVLAVTADRALGVDVEFRHRKMGANVPESCFSPHEAAWLRKLTPAVRKERWLDLWTFKESYIKARGLGMSVPLDHFSINLTDLDKAPISFDGIEDLPDRWALYRLRPSGDHIMALCVERLRGAVPELVSRTVVPFSSDAILQSWVERIGAHFMKGEGDGLTHHIPGYNEPA